MYQFHKNRMDKIKNYEELDRVKEDYHQTLEENEELENKVNVLADEVRSYYKILTEERHSNQNAIDALLSEKVRVEQELIQLQSSIQVAAVKNDSKESLEAELENLKALAVEKLSELEQISANTKLLSELQEEKIREIGELDSGIKALEGRILDGKKVLESIEDQIIITNNQLTELNVLKGAVLAVESGEGSVWEFKVPSDKSRLVELIHQLVDEYGNAFPILRKELLKAEWSSVWLPQVQQLCSREGLDRSGIYRLTLKSNSDVVYIGQAQSIKDR